MFSSRNRFLNPPIKSFLALHHFSRSRATMRACLGFTMPSKSKKDRGISFIPGTTAQSMLSETSVAESRRPHGTKALLGAMTVLGQLHIPGQSPSGFSNDSIYPLVKLSAEYVEHVLGKSIPHFSTVDSKLIYSDMANRTFPKRRALTQGPVGFVSSPNGGGLSCARTPKPLMDLEVRTPFRVLEVSCQNSTCACS